MLQGAADDYGVTSHPELRPLDELWASGDPPPVDVDYDATVESEPPGQWRFRILRGDIDDPEEADDWLAPEAASALYLPLISLVERIDPQAAARAPRAIELSSPAFSLELAEVVSIVVPPFAGVFADQLVSAAARWLCQRRPPQVARQTVELYGPDGEVLRTVTVFDRDP